MLRSFIALSLFLLPINASADQHAADACAAALPQDARLIYDSAAPAIAGASNPKDVVVEKTRALAQEGTISKLSARDNAMKAGSCLKGLR